MKTKEQLKKQWEGERNKFIEDQNNELAEFKKMVDFNQIYSHIESLLEESYIQHGKMSCGIDLAEFMPKDFEPCACSSNRADYYVRDFIVEELKSKGFNIGVSHMILGIG